MKNIQDAVKKHPAGATINLFVSADSNTNFFPADYNKWRNSLEISVKSSAKQNKANLDVIKTIAEFFDKDTTQVTIISGKKKRSKTVLIQNVNPKSVVDKIKESMDGL